MTELETSQVVRKLEEEIRDLRAENEALKRNEIELKQTLRRLGESEARFRLLVSQVRDYAIFMLSPTGHINSWNEGAQRIKGYLSKEIIGKHFSIFYPREDIEDGKPERELKIATETGKYEEEGWRLRKDGTRFWANVVITAIYNELGELVGFGKVTRDLTERKMAEERLLKKNQELAFSNSELEQFAYVASHDLQEPLRTVASYVQLLANRYSNQLDDEGKEFIHFAFEAAHRMRTLINDLLEYSRIGRATRDFEDINLSVLVPKIINEICATHPNVNIEITGKLPVICTAEVYMRQLFQNLITNAIKFAKAGVDPVIKICAGSHGSFWLFEVEDNGIGIEQEFRNRIFLIFQRLHTRIEYPGSGIGLSVCKKIVELHGGSIWVESQPGKGATFFFTLPALC